MKKTCLTWYKVKEKMPDDEATVLCFDPKSSGDPVWPGYHLEEHGGWISIDGSRMAHAPTMWAEMPHPEDDGYRCTFCGNPE